MRKNCSLAHRSVLMVEDEALIAMELEDVLIEFGFTIAGSARCLADGLRLAESLDFDIGLLDLNLNGESVDPIARAIAAKGVPIVFLTGYGEAGVKTEFKNFAVVQKPFLLADLKRALAEALQS